MHACQCAALICPHIITAAACTAAASSLQHCCSRNDRRPRMTIALFVPGSAQLQLRHCCWQQHRRSAAHVPQHHSTERPQWFVLLTVHSMHARSVAAASNVLSRSHQSARTSVKPTISNLPRHQPWRQNPGSQQAANDKLHASHIA